MYGTESSTVANIIDKYCPLLELLDFKHLLEQDALETKTNGPQKWVPRTILILEIMCRIFFNAGCALASSWRVARSVLLTMPVTDNGRGSIMPPFGTTLATRRCTRQCHKLHKATEWVTKKGFGIFKYRGHSRGRP